MFIGLVDLNTGRLDYCNAGHNPPVLGNGKGQAQFIEMLPNAPIGLWPGLDYEGEVLDNIKGCPMLFYTDGLNEAENQAQEQFGDDHLLEILHALDYGSAKEVVEHLVAEVEKHRNGAEPNDDLTIMCLYLK
jgi:serine phosphatase RsbU (regulator of sigma subunit)